MKRSCLALRHVAFENAGVIARVLAEEGFSLTVLDVGVDPLPLDDVVGADLLLVLGGPIGVYETEDYPFLKAELEAIRRRLAARRPTLGVCLGAQLMAAALGARVAPGPGKEIGYAPVELTSAGWSSALAPLAARPVLHWHGDNLELPAGALRLASTRLCPNQAFSLGAYALGLQFHLEVEPAALEAWLIGHTVELAKAKIKPATLRRQADEHGAATAQVGAQIVANWLKGAFA
jgi:GMP synthase (glutamine-hydrolysing)